VTYSKILVTGATGFIGSRLCEKLALQYRLPYRALVHNFSKAVRIARLGAEMAPGDLNNPAHLEAAVSGCDAVVHLAFGSAAKAEENLLAACRSAKIKRFVHVSSMAVYGPSPSLECTHERTAKIGRYSEPYSDAKVRAEKTIQRAINNGLPGIILRPTVVYGPYSPFVISIVRDARAGNVTLLDDGRGVCNAVYVDDVCDAIYAALSDDRALGQAVVINGDHAINWRDFNLTFANMISPRPQIANFSTEEARAFWQTKKPSFRSNLAAVKKLLRSSSFQDQLETVPAFRSAIRWSKKSLKGVLSADRISALAGPAARRPNQTLPLVPNPGRIVREDFRLEFSNELAKSLLNWTPCIDFARGAELTRTWLEYSGMLGPSTRGERL